MKHQTTSEKDLTDSKLLTKEDKQEAAIRVMISFSDAKQRWQERAKRGLNDIDLSEAVRYELGIEGYSGCRDSLKVWNRGAGLKIWASWDSINTYEQKPIFEGNQTIAIARHVFAIPNPDDKQMSLF